MPAAGSHLPYARRYRAARAFAGLSRGELAAALGVHSETVKRRELGQAAPGPGEPELVARICGVPEPFMLGGWNLAAAPDAAGVRSRRGSPARARW